MEKQKQPETKTPNGAAEEWLQRKNPAKSWRGEPLKPSRIVPVVEEPGEEPFPLHKADESAPEEDRQTALDSLFSGYRPEDRGDHWLGRDLFGDWRVWRKAAALSALLLACADDPQAPPQRDPALFAPQDEAAWTALTGASELLLPTGALLLDDPAGTPVSVLTEPSRDGITDPPACGNTFVTHTKEWVVAVVVEVYWPIPHEGCSSDLGVTVAHELIHSARAWAGVGSIWTGEDDHSTDGIYRAKQGDPRVEETTAEKLCEAVPCEVAR